ncbi:hypothetical protein HDU76_006367 [Blyttiomyces sp. JEL0837]|nr:hypothetical protein HDU76_006367 [Blyttiomyces sp. JEL0837]
MAWSLAAAFRNIPQATRALLFVIAALFLAGQLQALSTSKSQQRHPFLALYAGNLVRIWTFVTAGLFESNIYMFLLNGIAFLLSAKYFEQVWGSNELFRYVGIINVGALVLATATVLLEYMLTLNAALLFSTPINGLLAVVMGFLVAFKQTVPEHSLNLMQTFSIRVKHIPSIVISVYALLFVLRIVNTGFFLVLYGAIVSWVYIRFFKSQDGIRGDRSESFSFASFFPEAAHPFVIPVSNSTYNLMVYLNICPPLAASYLPANQRDVDTDSRSAPKPLPGTDIADAERRRAIALRALDMRLSASSSPGDLKESSKNLGEAPKDNEVPVGSGPNAEAK